MQWVSCFPQRLYLWIPCDAFFRIISSSVSELILHLFIGFLILGNPVFNVFIFIFNAFIFPSNLAFSNNIIYLFICNYYFSAYLLDAFKNSDFAVSLDCSFVSNSWELVPLMIVIVKTALWWVTSLYILYIFIVKSGFPGDSDSIESACNVGDLGLIPGLGRSPGVGNGNPLQYSCLGNPMDRRTWQTTDRGVTKNWTSQQLDNDC